MGRLTSEFGMESGVPAPPWTPRQNLLVSTEDARHLTLAVPDYGNQRNIVKIGGEEEETSLTTY